MGEVGRGAQFEHAGFLTSCDFDGLEETGFRARTVRLRPFERDLALEAMQFGEPKPFPGLLDKGEGFLQRRFGACYIARHQQGFGKLSNRKVIHEACARLALGVDRSADRGDIFLVGSRIAQACRMEDRTQ